MGWLQGAIDSVLNGLYAAIMWVLQWILIAVFKVLEIFMVMMSGIAELVLVDLNVGQYLTLSVLPADIAGLLGYLAVPQALNMLLTAYLIRFALSFIPL